jgi:hypothetical protein
MLHVEIHGHANRDGLVFASREFLSWEDISPYFRALNVTVRNSLVVILGVCGGAFALTAATNSPFDPTPFYGLIGPDRPVPGVLLPDAFEAFYIELLRTGDFVPAVNILRRFIPAYGGYDTATLFQLGWRKYVEMCNGDTLTTRVDNIVARIPQSELGSVGGIEKARAAIAAQIQATIHHRDRHYQRFIMTDRYPEIADRFPAIAPPNSSGTSAVRENLKPLSLVE